nr:RHS repeat-associated core domain-containing protein [Argonema antarcticum]
MGAVTDKYNYDAFGNLLSSTGNTNNNYLYRGEQFDPNLGWQYLRARYYDPNVGRFPNVDPFEGMQKEPMSRHRYLYGNANPVTYSDPSGEMTLAELDGALAVHDSIMGLGFGLTIAQRPLAYGFQSIGDRMTTWDGWYTLITGTLNNVANPSAPLNQILGNSNIVPLEFTAGPSMGLGFYVADSSPFSNGTRVENGLWLHILAGVGARIGFRNLPLGGSTSQMSVESPSFFAGTHALAGGVILGSAGATAVMGGGIAGGWIGFGTAKFSTGGLYGIDIGMDLLSGISIPIKGDVKPAQATPQT